MKSNVIIGTMRWGTWGENFSIDQAKNLIKFCYNENLIKFDLADVYGNYTTEALFGESLEKSGINRHHIKISTKCGILYPSSKYEIKAYNSSKEHIINSVNNSLKNLKTDYIDVLFLHKQDLLMDIEEIENAFTELKLSGKVRYFGVNNFSTFAFNILNKRIPLITNQLQFSLLNPETILNDSLLQLGNYNKKIQVSNPLGDYFISDKKNNNKLETKLNLLSEKYNTSIDNILLAWILKVPYKITPILGSTKIDRIKDQLEAFNIKLSIEEWYELLETVRGKTIH